MLLVLVLAPGTRVWGWGNTGHEAVAYVAWQHLNPSTRARVLVLLKRVPALDTPTGKTVAGYDDWVKALPPGLSKDKRDLFLFMRAATWADTIKHVGFTDSDVPPAGVTSDVNIGFTDKASHGYWHFVDKGFASDSSTVAHTPAPNAATQITALRQAIGSGEDEDIEAYDVVWLEHLVGDIHQPLHGSVRFFGGQGDLGGNLVNVKLPLKMKKQFEGTHSKNAPRKLHAFWDDLPGEGQPDLVLEDAEDFAKLLPAPGDTELVDIDPEDWAIESFTLAKKDAYVDPIGAATHPASGSYLVTDAYYNQALQDAKDRIALAGARLAKLLNDNLK
jgi:hypothetical protein